MKRARLLIALGVVAALPAVGGAQMNQQKFQSEGRIDAIFARSGAVEAAYGFTVPAGIYVRTGLVAGIGAGRYGVEGRTDAIARFSMDPFRQSRWAPYAGAGLSGRYRSERDGGSRAYLLVYLGVEGPLALGALEGWVPAFELGLGGGARVGVILRKGINARR
ncbi:MAG TPA: hypothetical protein VK491_07170 [Gemmatimonadaceae bacterium]|nr:hypothetical protein [Gemmatimonadaceae bacterium]